MAFPPHSDVQAEPQGRARDAAFDASLELLKKNRDHYAEQGYPDQEFIDQLKRAGLYRASTPQRFGGEPLPPSQFMEKIARIASIDPAAAWVASFGSSLVYFSALPEESQREIYGDGPDVVFAGGLFPMQEAEKVDGGFLCSGTWQFASGCHGADILGVGLRGGPETEGRPITALIDPDDAEIVSNWDVSGMRGTGSDGVRVEDLFVPTERTFVRGGTPTIDEPLTRYPATALAAQVLAVVALGAARGALDLVRNSLSSSVSITGGSAKSQRPTAQRQLALGEARLRAAYAGFMAETDRVWSKCLDDADITDDDRTMLRLMSTHAAHDGRDVIMAAFDIVGTGGIFRSHPIQRYLQDGMVPAQHAMLQSNTLEAAGALMLGLDSPIPSFP